MLTKAIKAAAATIGCTTILLAGFALDDPADYPDKTQVRYAPVEWDIPCTVIDVQGNSVCVLRKDGNAYYFLGEGYEVEQVISVRFNNNGTPYNTKDDYIVGCK